MKSVTSLTATSGFQKLITELIDILALAADKEREGKRDRERHRGREREIDMKEKDSKGQYNTT